MRNTYRTAAILWGLTLLLTACHKDSPATDPYDVAHNTAEQNGRLLKGDWIEDSARIEGVKTFIAVSPSHLSIDGDLRYSMYQLVVGSTNPTADTGYFVFDGNRNIQPISTGGSHYFAGFDRLVITLATDHRLVLYDFEPATNNITLFYHK